MIPIIIFYKVVRVRKIISLITFSWTSLYLNGIYMHIWGVCVSCVKSNFGLLQYLTYLHGSQIFYFASIQLWNPSCL